MIEPGDLIKISVDPYLCYPYVHAYFFENQNFLRVPDNEICLYLKNQKKSILGNIYLFFLLYKNRIIVVETLDSIDFWAIKYV